MTKKFDSNELWERRVVQKVSPAPENYTFDTIAQKIKEVQENHVCSLRFSEDEIIDHHRIDSICSLIIEGKLNNLTVLSMMTELCVEKIVKAAKGNKDKFQADLRCIQFQSISIVDLSAILKDYPSIECTISIFDFNRNKIGVNVINNHILSFAPDSSEDDSDESGSDSDNETSNPMNLVTPIAAAGVTKNFNLYPEHDS